MKDMSCLSWYDRKKQLRYIGIFAKIGISIGMIFIYMKIGIGIVKSPRSRLESVSVRIGKGENKLSQYQLK